MGFLQSKPTKQSHIRVSVPRPIFNPVIPPVSFYQGQVGVSLHIDAKSKHQKIQTVKGTTDKRDRIPSEIRNKVWTYYHGNNNKGICYSCGNSIERYQPSWHCSHVHSDVKGGKETVENLRTCCRHCNLSMGDQNLYAYIRDKNLTGPGARNINSYFRKYPSQLNDKRTNNWGRCKPK